MANYIKLDGTVSGLNYNLGGNIDEFQFVNIERVNLVCDTTNGPINIQLPKISNLGNFTNFEVIIDHTAGNATTNPITITVGDASDNINGYSGVILGATKQKMHFVLASLTDWMFSQSGCCASEFHTEYFGAVTASSIAVTGFIDQTKPILVIRTDAAMTGATLSQSTGATVRDFAIVDEVSSSIISFTDALVDANVQVQYYSTNFID